MQKLSKFLVTSVFVLSLVLGLGFMPNSAAACDIKTNIACKQELIRSITQKIASLKIELAKLQASNPAPTIQRAPAALIAKTPISALESMPVPSPAPTQKITPVEPAQPLAPTITANGETGTYTTYNGGFISFAWAAGTTENLKGCAISRDPYWIYFQGPSPVSYEMNVQAIEDATYKITCDYSSPEVSVSNSVAVKITPNVYPQVNVSAPNGNQTLTRGQAPAISWTQKNLQPTDTFTLSLLDYDTQDGRTIARVIAEGLSQSAGSNYTWIIPSGVRSDSKFKVKVEVFRGTQPITADVSDNYIIIQ